MKRFLLLSMLTVALAGCGSSGGVTSTPAAVPGRGALDIHVVPNPIVATRVSGETYEFPFEVVVRETGGQRVDINRVSANVVALGALPIASETYDAAKIRSLGFQTSVPANGELRYRFTQRRDVPDDRLFGSVSADLRVDAVDANGNNVDAGTKVTVTR